MQLIITAPADRRAKRVLAFIAVWNESAHPFAWTTRSLDKVLAKVDAKLAVAA